MAVGKPEAAVLLKESDLVGKLMVNCRARDAYADWRINEYLGSAILLTLSKLSHVCCIVLAYAQFY